MEKEDKIESSKPKYEMGGPSGVIGFLIVVPSLTYFVTEKCRSGQWAIFQIPNVPTDFDSYWNTNVSLGVLAWLGLQFGLYLVPVGEIFEAPALINHSGRRLKYRLNALFALAVNMGGLATAVLLKYPVTMISNNLLQMLTASYLYFFVLSIVLYLKGLNADKSMLNPAANTGNSLYDWFMGKELNPRIGSLDVKYVIFRSGMIGWILLNFVNVVRSYELHRGHTNASIIVVILMQLCYVLDTMWFEDGVVVSRDIVYEGLGANILLQFLMIPFTFCVQTRYLMQTNYSLSYFWLCATILSYIAGYWIFRGSNSEKNNFRRNPKDPALAHLKTMDTKRGTKLLISGWWSLSRHPNYFGDMIIAFSSAFPTGFGHFLPYLNAVFLVMLLLDRSEKDNEGCKEKYGKDWDIYCQKVKYKIVPYVY